jgi:hypothetical protein
MIESLIGKVIILCVHLCGYSSIMNKLMQITTISGFFKSVWRRERNKKYCNAHPPRNLAMASKARSDRGHGKAMIIPGLRKRCS